jgi:hypothetical protein
MLYALINEQLAEFSKHLDVVAKMYSELGVPYLDISSNKRIQANKDNADSIYSILSERNFYTDELLEEKNRKELGLIVNIGANIEALYIFCKDGETGKPGAIQKRLPEEKDILEEYEKDLGKFPANNDYADLLKEITVLKTLILPKMSEEDVKKFSVALYALRERIVK